MKQNYSIDIITSLFHEYFPEKEILQYSLCDGGAENSNFLIEAENEKYILKVFESSRNEIATVQNEIAIMVELRAKGVNVPEIFHAIKNGRTIIDGPDGKPTILMECVDGEKYRDTPLALDKIFLTGKCIAELHKNLEVLTKKYPVSETHVFDLKYIFQETQLRHVKPDYLDVHFIETIWSDLNSEKSRFLALPCQIIHDDLHSNNIIYKNGVEPFFIDFSDLVLSPCIQDIAISLVSWCFRKFWYPEGMTDYLRGYESIRPLSVDEKECLFACIEARLLNIVLIPYLDAGIGDFESLREYILENYSALKKFHEFGRENFMKYIP